jgi:type I restriction enzyme, S subunit
MANDNQGLHDAPTGLPASWVWANLDDICIVQGGYAFKSADYRQEGIPLLRISNIQDFKISFEQDTVFLETAFAERYKNFLVTKGDILVALSGATTGKYGIYDLPEAALLNQRVGRLKYHDPTQVASKYVFYYMEVIKQEIIKSAYGAAQPNISPNDLATFSIPVPPLSEQHRIVAKIEEQFTRLDAGVAALKRAQANLKRYKAAVLKAACEGKLVAQDPSDEPASHILSKVATSTNSTRKRAGRLWGSGMVPALTEEERENLPNGWTWAKVKDLGPVPDEVVQVGPMSMRSQDFVDSGVPVLNVGCVQWGRFNAAKLNFLPPEIAAQFDRYRIQAGDVLFTRSGTVGRCAVAREHQHGWLMTFHLLRARPSPDRCLPEYLRTVFEGASHVQRQTREASVGTTRAGFNTNLLAMLDVPLPPLAEQRRIVAEVERRLSVVQELEGTLAANLARAERLRQSILKRAFEGRLV